MNVNKMILIKILNGRYVRCKLRSISKKMKFKETKKDAICHQEKLDRRTLIESKKSYFLLYFLEMKYF
jgi:hypothetical protein